MNQEEWENRVPETIRTDALWKVEAYRLGLFLCDLARPDAQKLLKERFYWHIADQLHRAASNVSSNVAEGWSRGSWKDRARFFEYALGSVRETRDWYYKARDCLQAEVIEHRLNLGRQLARLLVKMIDNERKRGTRIERHHDTGQD